MTYDFEKWLKDYPAGVEEELPSEELPTSELKAVEPSASEIQPSARRPRGKAQHSRELSGTHEEHIVRHLKKKADRTASSIRELARALDIAASSAIIAVRHLRDAGVVGWEREGNRARIKLRN